MKICAKCGNPNNDDVLYCEKCGAAFPGPQYSAQQAPNVGGFNMNQGGYDQPQYSYQPRVPGGFDRVRFKSNAKAFFGNNSGRCICVSLLAIGMIYIPMMFASGLTGLADRTHSGLAGIFAIIALVLMLLGYVLAFDMMFTNAAWFRTAIYSEPTTRGYLDEAVSDIGGKFCCGLLMGVMITLWSLLLYFPGIIKTYQYSMAPYIKTENPNIKSARAIELSGIITNGHKWDLFVMDLSFIGWAFLSALTLNILGIVFVFPYYNSAKAFAYEDLKAQAVAMGQINPAELDRYANY